MEKNTPSRTAYKVALNIITLGAKPGMKEVLPEGIVSATKKLLVSSGAASKSVVRYAGSSTMVSIYEMFDWMLPGQFEAFAYRKAFCEKVVRDGIKAGAAQILVLGAGYDTLCWRLAPEFSKGVIFFEIDHPATAGCKAKGIDAMGQPDNLHLLAEDLGRRKLSEVLFNNESWEMGGQSVIIAEGLVMYLQNEAVEELFSQCAQITGQGSRIAFSYIPKGADGRPYAGNWTNLMLWLQKIAGEPWLWSIAPEELKDYLDKTGWKIAADDPGERGRKSGVEFYALATQ